MDAKNLRDFVNGMHGRQMTGSWYADLKQVDREARARANRGGCNLPPVESALYARFFSELSVFPHRNDDSVPLTLLALCDDNAEWAQNEEFECYMAEMDMDEYDRILEQRRYEFFEAIKEEAI